MDKLTLSLIGVSILGVSQLLSPHKEVYNKEDHNREAVGQNSGIPAGISLSEFTSNRYKISFKYPKSWVKNPRYEDKYEGENGFFEVGDFSGIGENIDEAVKTQVNESYKPYGSNPIIRSFIVEGQPVRVIYPSNDQEPFYKDRETAIVVQYPQPITVDGQKFDYAVIWTSRDFVPLILGTLKFEQ